MKLLSIAALSLLIAGPAGGADSGLKLQTVTIAGGRLVVVGTTGAPRVVVTIPGTALKTTSNVRGEFSFNVLYRPNNCRLTLATDTGLMTALVSMCGPRGKVGEAGRSGPRGPIGKTGARGVEGPVGPQGPEGPQGIAGPQGPQGQRGPEGPQGPAGPAGARVGFFREIAVSATVQQGEIFAPITAEHALPLTHTSETALVSVSFRVRVAEGDDGRTILLNLCQFRVGMWIPITKRTLALDPVIEKEITLTGLLHYDPESPSQSFLICGGMADDLGDAEVAFSQVDSFFVIGLDR